MYAVASSTQPRGRRGVFAKTLEPSLLRDLAEAVAPFASTHWPNPRWQDDPVGFVREVLGDEPTEAQVDFLEAVREHGHVAFRSGHKVGKSRTLVWIALWWFCTRENARVLMTSATEDQVDSILWRELVLVLGERKKKCAAKGIPFYELDCLPAQHAKTGLIAPDKREVRGLSSREAEAAAGRSSHNMLYLVDEASGGAETLFAAFEGNLAGGGKMVLASNPTRTWGQFFEAFQPAQTVENGGTWKTLHMSSAETPNVKSGRMLIKGMATREWVEARKLAWGEDSLDYKVRVLGEFPVNEERRMLTLHAILESQRRWDLTEASGPLRGGLDVAGAGAGGDDSVFSFRRGLKQIKVDRFKGNLGDHLARLLGHMRELRVDGDYEPLRLCVDAEGFGWATYEHLAAYAVEHPNELVIIGVKGGQHAEREPTRFERVRDELFYVAEKWIKDGGALIPDDRIAQEAHAAEWVSTARGLLKATDKDTLRKILGRSPDSYDAHCLSCWEPDHVAEHVAETHAMARREAEAEVQRRVPRLDPYAGGRAWRR